MEGFPSSSVWAARVSVLPRITAPVEEIYRLTYARLLEKNRRYYERYPGDVDRVRAVARILSEGDVRLPAGGTVRPGGGAEHVGAIDVAIVVEPDHEGVAFADEPVDRSVGGAGGHEGVPTGALDLIHLVHLRVEPARLHGHVTEDRFEHEDPVTLERYVAAMTKDGA